MKGISYNSFPEPEDFIKRVPDRKGYFGIYGGRFVPETLMPALKELEEIFFRSKKDKKFQEELSHLQKTYIGRPTPLYFARRFTEYLAGAKIYLKREDLAHTGAHKINNALGQSLLAKKMGKTRVIAETGAGQHGVATATGAALVGLECEIYMGTEDMKRQAFWLVTCVGHVPCSFVASCTAWRPNNSRRTVGDRIVDTNPAWHGGPTTPGGRWRP